MSLKKAINGGSDYDLSTPWRRSEGARYDDIASAQNGSPGVILVRFPGRLGLARTRMGYVKFVKRTASVFKGSTAPGAVEVHVRVVFWDPSDVKAERQFFFGRSDRPNLAIQFVCFLSVACRSTSSASTAAGLPVVAPLPRLKRALGRFLRVSRAGLSRAHRSPNGVG
jgi:hypothetical protein